VQVKQKQVMRVLPLENEAINECWLSDKDRFSYEGLNSPERLTQPLLKRNGRWEEVEWALAIEEAVWGLKGRDMGILASPHSTLEELYLAGKLAQGAKDERRGAADFRLRQSDFSADGKLGGIPWLGMSIPELSALDRVLVVGSFLRKDHPLIAHRLRQAAKRGAKIYKLHSADDDWLMPIAGKKIVAPSQIPGLVFSFEDELKSGKNAAILLGNFAQQHSQAAQIHAAAQALAQAANAKLGFLGEAANSVGGYLAGLPVGGNARSIVENPPKALVLLNVEPELDCADPRAALAAAKRAEFVVALSAFRTGLDYANVILPIGAFTETAGTFVNTEGRAQSFHPSVNPPGESRPGWKVLRVLGSMLGIQGFELDTIEQVRAQCLQGKDIAALLSNKIDLQAETKNTPVHGIQRVADVPIYFADPLVRRSPPLQETADAEPPRAWMNSRLMTRLALSKNDSVLIKQEAGEARLRAALDDRLPDECVRIAAAHRSTAELGPMSGTVAVEKIPVEQAA
jgi:NADH-quinone oxidoreductase subunit G